jgi:predicted phosphodiesterase
MGVRGALAVVCVAVAVAGAAAGAAAVFQLDRDLSTGAVRLSVEPGHEGALDLYVPLVDWGVRFPGAVRLPARLSVDLRTVDRAAAERVAGGDVPELEQIRAEATDAIAAYIRLLLAAVAAAALAAGALVALALRSRYAPLPALLATAVLATAGCCVALALLLPPRGELGDPEYYANGPDIPAALRAVEQATRSSQVLSQELDAQLVGLARLVAAPSGRAGGGVGRRLTLASDLHNNLLALPTLERAVDGGPLFFAGDLTANGSPFEVALTRRIARIATPLVFVTGNHDSDALARRLAEAGAVVLTERGRLRADGTLGAIVTRVAGLRVAGYSDPDERLRADGYRDRYDDEQVDHAERRRRFADWLRPLVGRIDIAIVHQRGLARQAVAELRADPPPAPLVLLSGHTHRAALRISDNLVELNGGTAGGGGAGNLDEGQPIGLAALSYALADGFEPLAADTVEIDPRSGAASASRTPIPTGARDPF